jgi:hypothetical protein
MIQVYDMLTLVSVVKFLNTPTVAISLLIGCILLIVGVCMMHYDLDCHIFNGIMWCVAWCQVHLIYRVIDNDEDGMDLELEVITPPMSPSLMRSVDPETTREDEDIKTPEDINDIQFSPSPEYNPPATPRNACISPKFDFINPTSPSLIKRIISSK